MKTLFVIFTTLTVSIASAETLQYPRFYKAERANKVIYLLGTQHVGIRISELPEPILEKIKNASLVASENGNEVFRGVKAAYKSNTPLASILSLEAAACAQRIFGTHPGRIYYKISAVRFLISMALHGMTGGTQMLDEELLAFALKEKRTVMPLDDEKLLIRGVSVLLKEQYTPEEKKFTEILVCHGNELQTVFQEATDMLTERYKAPGQLSMGADERALNAFFRAKLTPLLKPYDLSEEQVHALFADEPTPREMLQDRNLAWIPKIEGFLADRNDLFLFFGASHLYGEEGVLKLLKNAGFKISAL